MFDLRSSLCLALFVACGSSLADPAPSEITAPPTASIVDKAVPQPISGQATQLHGLRPQATLPPLDSLVPTTWHQQLQRTAVSLHQGQSFCTGTWLSKHAVLTAAHCVQGMQPGSFQIVPQADARNPSVVLLTSGYRMHPSYTAAMAAKRGDLVPAYAADFAVVEVPAGMPPTARTVILDFDKSVQNGMQVHVAGYGHTGLVNGQPQGSGLLRNGVFRSVYKFENKQRKANTVGHYWVVDGGLDKVCNGDSGGPTFWVSDTTIMQFGVNSYISALTQEQIKDLVRLDAKSAAGQLWSPVEFDFYGRMGERVMDYKAQSCSNYLQVASIGEARDWIQQQSTQIEAGYR